MSCGEGRARSEHCIGVRQQDMRHSINSTTVLMKAVADYGAVYKQYNSFNACLCRLWSTVQSVQLFACIPMCVDTRVYVKWLTAEAAHSSFKKGNEEKKAEACQQTNWNSASQCHNGDENRQATQGFRKYDVLSGSCKYTMQLFFFFGGGEVDRCVPTPLCPCTAVSQNWYVHVLMCLHTNMSLHWCVPKLICPHTSMSLHCCVPELKCPHTNMSPHSYVPVPWCLWIVFTDQILMDH